MSTLWRFTLDITSPVLGGVGANVFHMRSNSGDPEDQIPVFGTQLQELYLDLAIAFNETTTVSWDGTATQVNVGEPLLSTGWETWSVEGGTTTRNLPPANALCLSWRSASATRSGRGRTFLGPLSEDCAEANGTPDETARSNLATAATSFIDATLGEADSRFVIYSPTHETSVDVVSVRVPNKFAVLRSRRD